MLGRRGYAGRRAAHPGGSGLTERRHVQVAHTADLDAAGLRAVRALLDDVFGDDMTEDAWDHALGGVHALAWAQGRLVGHASVVQRRLMYRDRTLRTGYVEAVAVRADQRRQGVGGGLMAALERILGSAYDVGALGATDEGALLYASRGWRQWQGETWALSPTGPVRTAGEDHDVYVLEVSVALDLHERLTCDWRDGDLW